MEKEKFLNNEIWTLTFAAAFQRANVYNPKIEISNDDKKKFKERIRKFIEELAKSHYHETITDDNLHIKNIKEISSVSADKILKGGKLRFGVSQKLLNLYLKYSWCLNKIAAPPHFPVDRRIQDTLGLTAIAWTQMENEEEYMNIINYVRQIVKPNQSIAEYELEHFERR